MSVRAGKWTVFVDVVGGCNLRCPSCPVGNSSTDATPHGLMSSETMERIAEKAVRELGSPRFYLFNWAEPFLHPRLDALVRILKRHNVPVEISTNGNISRNADKVMAAAPDTVIVSVSGFQQENYGKTHKRGDIERVKVTMRKLSELKASLKVPTKLTVRFHRYLGNHADEDLMKAFAVSLGFEFAAGWAYFMPAEKLVALGEGGLGSNRLTHEDREIIARLALNPLEAIEAAKAHRHKPCRLLDRSLALSYNGDVLLCCATYDMAEYGVGNYLEKPIAELQGKRENHDYCASCTAQGGHIYFNNEAPEFDEIAAANVLAKYPELRGRSFKTVKNKSPLHRVIRSARRMLGLPELRA